MQSVFSSEIEHLFSRLTAKLEILPDVLPRYAELPMKTFQQKPTILLAAKNADWLAEVGMWLKASEYNVLIADSGDKAFCLARSQRPDLIVSEIALPDISGIQLCYMMRADEYLSGVLFILIGESGFQNNDTFLECLSAGANDYFAKNFQRQLLKEKIIRLIKFQRSETEIQKRLQNLIRSEWQIPGIIKDSSNLDAAAGFVAFTDLNSRKCMKSAAAITSPKPQADILKAWKLAVHSKDIIATHKFGSRKREKVYFEVVK